MYAVIFRFVIPCLLTLTMGQNLWAQSGAKPATQKPPASKDSATAKTPPIPAKKPIPVKEKKVDLVMETSMGRVEMELNNEQAPISVKNFLNYVDRKFYDGTVFHRVIKDFMIQGGGFTKDLKVKPTDAAIKNEATNGLKNKRGTLAMARTNKVDSATSQFFINHKDNAFLNHTRTTPQDYGYAVFGKVTKGMDVVDKIANVKTTASNSMRDVPKDPVIIKSIRRKKDKK